jgi:tetratricopeptide (TPR) repeat protein
MRATALLLVLGLALLPACQMNERLSGTVMGAVGGGVIGGVTAGATGAVVGTVAGGVAGYLIGDYLADQRERGRAQVFGDSPPAAYAPAQGSVGGIKVDAARAAYERGQRAPTAPEARTHFEEALRLDPTRPEPYNALGYNALFRGDRPEAERLWREALRRDPSYHPARHNIERLAGGTLR